MEGGQGGFFARVANHRGLPWRGLLVLGVITLLVGILALVYPGITLSIIGVLFGLQLLVVGVFHVVMAFSGDDRHRVLSTVLGILAIIVGILCLREITQTVVLLTLLLGIYWVVSGVIQIVVAVGSPLVPFAGLAVLTGILSLLAGLLLLCFPLDSAFGIAILLGVWLVLLGVLEIVAAFRLRKAGRGAF